MSCSSGICGPRRATVCVYPATGLVGMSCIAELYKSYSWYLNIRACVESEPSAAKLRTQYPAIEVVEVSEPSSLKRAFCGVRSALLINKSMESAEQECEHTLNVLEVAHEAGVQHLVYLSSFSVAARADMDSLAVRHMEPESRVSKLWSQSPRHYYTILRVGPLMDIFVQQRESIEHRDELVYPNVSSTFVYSRDVGHCAAHLLGPKRAAIEHNRKVYKLNGIDVLSIQTIANLFSKALKREIKWIEASATNQMSSYLLKNGSSAEFLINSDLKELLKAGDEEPSSFEMFIKLTFLG